MSRLFAGKPSISLTGFMFTGKSSVGRALARRLGLKFVDLDEEITRNSGEKIEEIFARGGEPEFRRLEREAVRRLVPLPGQVISTGGGVVSDPENRGILACHSCVVWLQASAETVLERFRSSGGRPRPLLAGPDPQAVILRLLTEREPWYRECDFWISTDGCSVDEVCAGIIEKISAGGGK